MSSVCISIHSILYAIIVSRVAQALVCIIIIQSALYNTWPQNNFKLLSLK